MRKARVWKRNFVSFVKPKVAFRTLDKQNKQLEQKLVQNENKLDELSKLVKQLVVDQKPDKNALPGSTVKLLL